MSKHRTDRTRHIVRAGTRAVVIACALGVYGACAIAASDATPGPGAQEGEAGYRGEILSLDFQDLEVRSVLQLIADFAGLGPGGWARRSAVA